MAAVKLATHGKHIAKGRLEVPGRPLSDVKKIYQKLIS